MLGCAVHRLPYPGGDDASISIEIVGHYMGKPCERVLGENYNENLRAAIDQACTAEAYPPRARVRPVRPAKEAP